MGYEYKDVVESAKLSQNTNSGSPMVKNTKIVISIDFRDWKWISNF